MSSNKNIFFCRNSQSLSPKDKCLFDLRLKKRSLSLKFKFKLNDFSGSIFCTAQWNRKPLQENVGGNVAYYSVKQAKLQG